MESWADDYTQEDENEVRVISQKQDLASVVKYLKEASMDISEYSLGYVPNTLSEVTDFDKALKIIKLVEDLEGDEDIEKVWHNYNISDELQNQVLDALEKARFRT